MGSGLRLEATVQSEIRFAVNSLSFARLVRNNVGSYENNGQWVQYGLGKGSPDLVGWVQMENGIARVFCIEVKREDGGVIEPEQKASITAINKRGGAAAVCRSAASAVAFAARARAGELFSGVPVLS